MGDVAEATATSSRCSPAAHPSKRPLPRSACPGRRTRSGGSTTASSPPRSTSPAPAKAQPPTSGRVTMPRSVAGAVPQRLGVRHPPARGRPALPVDPARPHPDHALADRPRQDRHVRELRHRATVHRPGELPRHDHVGVADDLQEGLRRHQGPSRAGWSVPGPGAQVRPVQATGRPVPAHDRVAAVDRPALLGVQEAQVRPPRLLAAGARLQELDRVDPCDASPHGRHAVQEHRATGDVRVRSRGTSARTASPAPGRTGSTRWPALVSPRTTRSAG